ncbi:MAG: hypothetical protein PHG05_01310 [Candidatus Nanoarchaeia archaeon]|nr:hypothetical protein [Candidatus Nanoarchaeia archaeon]
MGLEDTWDLIGTFEQHSRNAKGEIRVYRRSNESTYSNWRNPNPPDLEEVYEITENTPRCFGHPIHLDYFGVLVNCISPTGKIDKGARIIFNIHSQDAEISKTYPNLFVKGDKVYLKGIFSEGLLFNVSDTVVQAQSKSHTQFLDKEEWIHGVISQGCYVKSNIYRLKGIFDRHYEYKRTKHVYRGVLVDVFNPAHPDITNQKLIFDYEIKEKYVGQLYEPLFKSGLELKIKGPIDKALCDISQIWIGKEYPMEPPKVLESAPQAHQLYNLPPLSGTTPLPRPQKEEEDEYSSFIDILNDRPS